MGLEGGPVGAGQGHVHKVLAGVEVAEGGGHVHREVVPLEAVLLSDAHGGGVCVACHLQIVMPRALRLNTQENLQKKRRENYKKNFVNPGSKFHEGHAPSTRTARKHFKGHRDTGSIGYYFW